MIMVARHIDRTFQPLEECLVTRPKVGDPSEEEPSHLSAPQLHREDLPAFLPQWASFSDQMDACKCTFGMERCNASSIINKLEA